MASEIENDLPNLPPRLRHNQRSNYSRHARSSGRLCSAAVRHLSGVHHRHVPRHDLFVRSPAVGNRRSIRQRLVTPLVWFSDRSQRWVVRFWDDDGKKRSKRFNSEAAAMQFAPDAEPKQAGRKSPPVEVADDSPPPIDIDSRLVPGVELSIKGEPGRFRYKRTAPDGAITCWGPIDRQQASCRSFRSDRLRTIHRKQKGREAVKQKEAL